MLFIVTPLLFLTGMAGSEYQSAAAYAPHTLVQSSSPSIQPSYRSSRYVETSAVQAQAFSNPPSAQASSTLTHGQGFNTLLPYGTGQLPLSQLPTIRPLSQTVHPSLNLSSNLKSVTSYDRHCTSDSINWLATHRLNDLSHPFQPVGYSSKSNLLTPPMPSYTASPQNLSSIASVTRTHQIDNLPPVLSQSSHASVSAHSSNRWNSPVPSHDYRSAATQQTIRASSHLMSYSQASVEQDAPLDLSKQSENVQQSSTVYAGESARMGMFVLDQVHRAVWRPTALSRVKSFSANPYSITISGRFEIWKNKTMLAQLNLCLSNADPTGAYICVNKH